MFRLFSLFAVCITLATAGESQAADAPSAPKSVTICTGTGCLVGTLVPSPVDPTCQRFMVGDVKKGVVKDGWFFPAVDDGFGAPVLIGGKTGAACTCANCPVGANCGGACGVQGCGTQGGCASCGAGGCQSCGSGSSSGHVGRQRFHLFHRRGCSSCAG